MTTRTLLHRLAVAATLGTLAAVGAHAATSLPPVKTSGAVTYLTGGIGQTEATAIERAGKDWPLTLEFAVKDKKRADYVADVKVIVRDAKGHEALRATATGPFLLARLAPGRYAVEATFDGKTLHDRIQIRHGRAAKHVFVWPAGTGEHPA